MGNEASTPRRQDDSATDRARKAVGNVVKKLDNGVASSDLLDNLCGPYFDDGHNRSYQSGYSEDAYSEDETQFSDNDTMDSSRYGGGRKKDHYSESGSMLSQSTDYESEMMKPSRRKRGESHDTAESLESSDWKQTRDENGVVTETTSDVGPGQLSKPLASSFAKRCYFTKAGIGKTTQHYEGLTLTGNIVLMLASAMKLKGCPTICDEDLRRVEQTYPNQFSRLPDELLLSSGWRRISKYCHFSNKPIPDGIPFFHSRQRVHPSGGYYFLLAAAVGMIRPIDVAPLTRDMLVLLETDYPTPCDQAPPELIQDASNWTLVDKFCFFSGGPINAEEDVYYQADFDGNPIFMLAFLSPSLTPEELYKLGEHDEQPGLKSVMAVHDVESVYDLTERDFDDLKLYHLGPCRALPQYILQPDAWTKVLPPHFLIAKEEALIRAHEYEVANGTLPTDQQLEQQPLDEEPFAPPPPPPHGYEYGGGGQFEPHSPHQQPEQAPFVEQPPELAQQFAPVHHASSGSFPFYPEKTNSSFAHDSATQDSITHEQNNFQREVEEEGAFVSTTCDAPIDEALASRARLPPMMASKGSHVGVSPPGYRIQPGPTPEATTSNKMDPPEDEPPSLSRRSDVPEDENSGYQEQSEPSYYQEEEPSYESGTSPHQEDYDERQNEGGYYRESEYYDSPEKGQPPNDGGTYYTREEEYYDSPENIPPNTDEGNLREDGDSYYDVPDKAIPNDYSPREGHYPPEEEDESIPKEGEYYTAETEKKTADDANHGDEQYYASPPGGGDEGEQYYASPPKGGDRYASPPVGGDRYASPPGGGDRYASPPGGADRYASPPGGADHYAPPPGGTPSEGYSEGYVSEEYVMGDAEESPPPDTSRTEEENIVSDAETSFTEQLKPVASSHTSGRSMESSAMRGAHELLKRARQKRLEESTRNQNTAPEEDPASPARKQRDEKSNSGAWETASEMTSAVSGSSVWTENSTADRTSRRALILQMAKARMKSNKKAETPASHEEDGSAIAHSPATKLDLLGSLD